MMKSEKLASERFAEFNGLYFGNRLPTYRILRRARFGGGGLCRKREREIHLPTGIEGVELDRVLVHEMAHAAAKGNGHGKAWRSEMQRLAEMGAPGALEDLTAYLNPLQVISARELIAEARDHGLMNPGDVRSAAGCRISKFITKRFEVTGESTSKRISSACAPRAILRFTIKPSSDDRDVRLNAFAVSSPSARTTTAPVW